MHPSVRAPVHPCITQAGFGFSLKNFVGMGFLEHPSVFERGFLANAGDFELSVVRAWPPRPSAE